MRILLFGSFASLFFFVPGVKEHVPELIWFGVVVLTFSFLLGLYLARDRKYGICPVCAKQVSIGILHERTDLQKDASIAIDTKIFEYQNCFEFVTLSDNKLRIFTGKESKGVDAFDAPVLKDIVWPHECITCGKSVTHTQSLSTSKISKAHIAGNLIAGGGIDPIQKGQVENVPYGNDHLDDDDVVLVIRENQLRLIFKSLDIRRRYLAVNCPK